MKGRHAMPPGAGDDADGTVCLRARLGFQRVAGPADIDSVGDFRVLWHQAGLPVVRPVRDLLDIGCVFAARVAAAHHHMEAVGSNEKSMRPEHRFQFSNGRVMTWLAAVAPPRGR